MVPLGGFCFCNLQMVHNRSRIARKSCGLVFLVPAQLGQAMALMPRGHKGSCGPCFWYLFFIWLLLVDSSVSFHDQLCCSGVSVVQCLVLSWERVLGCFLGGGAGSTSSLFTAPLPSKHPWGHLWVVATRRVAVDACVPY